MKRKCRSEHLHQEIHRTSRHMYTSLYFWETRSWKKEGLPVGKEGLVVSESLINGRTSGGVQNGFLSLNVAQGYALRGETLGENNTSIQLFTLRSLFISCFTSESRQDRVFLFLATPNSSSSVLVAHLNLSQYYHVCAYCQLYNQYDGLDRTCSFPFSCYLLCRVACIRTNWIVTFIPD